MQLLPITGLALMMSVNALQTLATVEAAFKLMSPILLQRIASVILMKYTGWAWTAG